MQNPYKFVSNKSKGLKTTIWCLYDETIQNTKVLVEPRLFSKDQRQKAKNTLYIKYIWRFTKTHASMEFHQTHSVQP